MIDASLNLWTEIEKRIFWHLIYNALLIDERLVYVTAVQNLNCP
ncbi:14483_t:CDS:2 [Racocetra fulgida]|uniref:14483_t:CDS:1 n=1 Tax=Racocetra fulgida TaxID=60492 RepID=A0A9N9A155_9GLOM|nr:14483_t:CDS:2 [Racocetra fulgida]